MNRRLRLALLLAALTVIGPAVPTPHALAPRVLVGIEWVRQNTASHSEKQRCEPGTLTCVAEDAEFRPPAAPVLPDAFRVHSLFQRPPPLRA